MISVRRPLLALCLGGALTSALGGCSSALDAASAYDSEAFLCGQEQADRWALELGTCRDEYERDHSCGGIASLTGRMQGQPLTVDSRLDISRFEDVLRADGVRMRNEIKLTGLSPYFRFRLRLWEVGGDMSGGERTLQVISGQAPGDGPFLDSFVRASLRLSASGQSVESPAGAGTVSLLIQSESEQAGSFHLGLGGDAVDGCFHAFLTEYSLTPGGAL